MKRVLQLTVFIVLTSTSMFASQKYSGYLVASDCYKIASGNARSTSTVDRDMDWPIRLCAPNTQTKSFALVQLNWQVLKFDSEGNAKAAELVRDSVAQEMFVVTMTGETDGRIIKVVSISSK